MLEDRTRARVVAAWSLTAAALLVLGVIDVLSGQFSGSDNSPLRLVWSVAACALLLASWGLRPRALALVVVLQVALALGAALLPRGDAPLPFPFAASVALLATLTPVVLRVGRPRSWALGVPLVLAVAAQALGAEVGDLAFTVLALVLAQATALFVAAGSYLRSTAAARREQVDRTRAADRAELARDLHDYVAHHVTGIVVQAQGAAAVARTHPELVVTALGDIERAGAEAVHAMRRVVGLLRDTGPDAQAPGVADLPDLVARSGLPVALELAGPVGGVPAQVGAAAHRVVMEALTNVRKHGRGVTRVEVLLVAVDHGLGVQVTDDGAGSPGSGGFGLLGLRERVTAVGGTLFAGARGPGWVVRAWLPTGQAGFDAGDDWLATRSFTAGALEDRP
ncbi:sensor histidine kinase [Actinosynnema sp.]|uniref:sensor histidine kinase n=1 Tax=Actinosynnema sp. TaxID=1872144 RepID=UPI003F85C8EC